MIIADRSSTRRVPGVAASVAVRSHVRATSTLKRHVSGMPGSSPPSS
jgi:hypothetical protein